METTIECVINSNEELARTYKEINDYVLEAHHDIMNIVGLTCFYGKFSCFVYPLMASPHRYPKSTLTICKPEIKKWFDKYFDTWRKEVHQLEIGSVKKSVGGKVVGKVTFYGQRQGLHRNYCHWNYVTRLVNNQVEIKFGPPLMCNIVAQAEKRIRIFAKMLLAKITNLPVELIREILEFVGFDCNGEWIQTQNAGQTLKPQNTGKRKRLSAS